MRMRTQYNQLLTTTHTPRKCHSRDLPEGVAAVYLGYSDKCPKHRRHSGSSSTFAITAVARDEGHADSEGHAEREAFIHSDL
jgi:hypothetical protein